MYLNAIPASSKRLAGERRQARKSRKTPARYTAPFRKKWPKWPISKPLV